MNKSRQRGENKHSVFRRASLYRAVVMRAFRLVRDSDNPKYGFSYSERHLQCVWFDEFHRPAILHTLEGEEVAVESPGRWNLEPGPDFLDAVLLIGRERRRVVGDVEIHVHPSDWQRHDHRHDGRYSRVVAHVSYFSGTSQSVHLPPNAVEISLEDDLRTDRLFSFESVDTSAYPYAERRSPTPCGEALAGRSADCAVLLLEAAGETRLELKAERIGRAVEQYGEEQVLYQEVMCALGYKNNRGPFRCLAGHVPVESLRRESAGHVEKAFALLLGMSGLLPAKISPRWDDETRAYVRRLWDFWWKRRPSCESPVIPRQAWSLAGLRPQNHPVRRIAAAAALFGGSETLLDRFRAIESVHPGAWVNLMMGALSAVPSGSYWKRRLSLSGPPLRKDVSLVGAERAAAILCNVMVPLMAATGRLALSGVGIQDLLPASHDDGMIRRTASALFGRDHNPRLYRTGLRQQGLLQICHDFCENDRSACKACALPSAITAFPDRSS